VEIPVQNVEKILVGAPCTLRGARECKILTNSDQGELNMCYYSLREGLLKVRPLHSTFHNELAAGCSLYMYLTYICLSDCLE